MNRIPLLLSIILFIFSSLLVSAQEDDGNLIKNGSFEQTTSLKYKKLGQFSLVSDWTTASEEKADLFSKLSEYPEIGAPDNALGRSNPKEGDNYVGLLLHNVASKDGRMYITSELNTMLKKGQKYCLSYSISLADASKFATNNLGFSFSKKAEFEVKGVLIRNNAIYPTRNKVQANRESWEDLCLVFTAGGTEKFITIGNFAQSSVTVTEKMEASSTSKIEQQQIGYYYLDALFLKPVARDSECICEKDDEPEGPRIIFSKSAALQASASPQVIVNASTVYFYSNEADLAEATKKDLDALTVLLQAKKDLKLSISGHMDSFEANKGKEFDTFKDLSKMRAEKVRDYLVEKGISSSRLTVESFKASQPVTEMKTPLSLAKNRRVQFSLR
jgi:outer membrane protein OmpA-like peptidoglycan-associated protein